MLDSSFDLVFSYELPLVEKDIASIYLLASAWMVLNQYEIVFKKVDSIEAVYTFSGDSPTILELDSKIIIMFNSVSRKDVLSVSFYLDSIYENKKKDAQKLWKEKLLDFIEYLNLDRALYSDVIYVEDLNFIIDKKNKEMYIAILPIFLVILLLMVKLDVITSLICLPIMFFISNWLLKKKKLRDKFVDLRKDLVKNIVL